METSRVVSTKVEYLLLLVTHIKKHIQLVEYKVATTCCQIACSISYEWNESLSFEWFIICFACDTNWFWFFFCFCWWPRVFSHFLFCRISFFEKRTLLAGVQFVHWCCLIYAYGWILSYNHLSLGVWWDKVRVIGHTKVRKIAYEKAIRR